MYHNFETEGDYAKHILQKMEAKYDSRFPDNIIIIHGKDISVEDYPVEM